MIKKIFSIFEKEGIDYCILRNYESIEKDSEIDILVEDKNKLKIVMKKWGFKKGLEYGPYLSYKNKIKLDFKVGYLPYEGIGYENSKKILNKKKRYKFFYILDKKDELIHLILHSIIDKGFYKEEYLEKIEDLKKDVEIKEELEKKFREIGKRLDNLIKKGDYKKTLELKKELLWKLIRLKDVVNFFVIKLIRIYRKFRK